MYQTLPQPLNPSTPLILGLPPILSFSHSLSLFMCDIFVQHVRRVQFPGIAAIVQSFSTFYFKIVYSSKTTVAVSPLNNFF